MGKLRSLLSEGVLGRFFKNQLDTTGSSIWRSGYDGAGFRRRLKGWVPSQYTTNVIMTSSGRLLRARCRDVLRNNPHANAAAESFAANVIGTGIKPSSLLSDQPDLRATLQRLWLDWTDECDADGLADF